MSDAPTNKVDRLQFHFKVKRDSSFGRPSLCTPDRTAAFAAALKSGATREVAAATIGVAYQTCLRWMRRGYDALDAYSIRFDELADAAVERGEEPTDDELDAIGIPASELPFIELYLATSQIEFSVEQFAVGAWMQHFEKDWKAAQAFLAARFPDRWGNARKIQSIENKSAAVSNDDDIGQGGAAISQVHIYIPDNGRGGGPIAASTVMQEVAATISREGSDAP